MTTISQKRPLPNFRKLRHDVNDLHDKFAALLNLPADISAIIKGEQVREEKPPERDFAALLAAARFDHAAPPPAPVPLYSLAGQTIATAENIMVVQAKAKAGKSAAIGAMIAATMEPTGDCLWFASANPGRHAVIHLDTEQSRFDHYQSITRSIRRAGKSALPPWVYTYHVKGHSAETIRQLLFAALELAAKETGGVHSCIVDGIGDLCTDVNDAAEANALVAEMESLAVKFKCLIVCVIHENPSSEGGKTRGHLGSQLTRKAETNLRLEKDGEGVTIMYADFARSAHITKKQAPGFRWDDEQKCHVSVETSINAMRTSKLSEQYQALVTALFENDGGVGLTWTQLRDEIMNQVGVSRVTAERTIKDLKKGFFIYQSGETYRRK